MKSKNIYTFGAIILIIIIAVLLGIKTFSSSSSAPTQAELDMAAMMGITIEEMRNQTPEEHMQAMMSLGGARDDNNGFLAAQGIDVATLPEVQPTQVLQVSDGDTIELSPTIVRKTINGKQFAMYGYNGQIPGPIIKSTQGAQITVNVTNKIDMPTTVHWHGLRLQNANDGVPGITQEAIEPNGNFTYTVDLPDEGMYWYHPHVREDIQQDLGLYGNLLVEPTDTSVLNPVNEEQIIMLDDLMLDENAQMLAYGSAEENNEDVNYSLMGRFGNVMLVNGEPDYSIDIERGSVQRFYITNTANTRTFNLEIPFGAVKLISSDGGRYERETFVESIIVAPSERVVFEAHFPQPGTFTLQHNAAGTIRKLATITVSNTAPKNDYSAQFFELKTNKDIVADIDAFRKYFDKPADHELEIDIEMSGMDHSGMMMEEHTDDGIEWEDNMAQMNAMMTGDQVEWKFIDTATGKENMDINWQFKVGDVKKVKVINNEDSAHPMQHPVHFHGQRFLVLSIDGVPSDNLVWKDTALVPTGSTAELLFDITNPGKWMFHCHIAEHLTNGMMGMFTVSP